METLIEAKLVNLAASMSSMWCNQQRVLHVPPKTGEIDDIPMLLKNDQNHRSLKQCFSLWTDPSVTAIAPYSSAVYDAECESVFKWS